MKKRIEIFLGVLFLLICIEADGIGLREAVKRKIIKLEVRWRSMEGVESVSGMHGTNLRVAIQNISKENITVEVPCGSMFTPLDSTRQNMIIAEDMKFVIAPNERSAKYAHGYCCEAHDRSPSENEVYLFKKNAGDKLVKLTEFVRDSSADGYCVQRAIWCVSDNYDLWDINAPGTGLTAALIKYTGKLKGVSQSDIDAAIKRANKNSGKVFEEYVNIQVPVQNDTYIWIMIQDINNNTVKYVALKQWVQKGSYKRDVGVSSIDLGAGTFYVRVYSPNGFLTEKQFSLAR